MEEVKVAKRLLLVLLLLGVAVATAGCVSQVSKAPTSTGTMAISLTSGPTVAQSSAASAMSAVSAMSAMRTASSSSTSTSGLSAVTAVNITIESILAKHDELGWQTIRDAKDPPIDINLLNLTTTKELVGQGQIASGHYSELKLVISKVSLVLATGGPPLDIPMTSPNNEIAVKIDALVQDGAIVRLIVNFDAGQSFQLGGGDPTMTPVVEAEDEDEVGKIEGYVGAYEQGVEVKLVDAAETVVASVNPDDEDGEFEFHIVDPGTYMVVVTWPSAGTVEFKNIEVGKGHESAIGALNPDGTITAPPADEEDDD